MGRNRPVAAQEDRIATPVEPGQVVRLDPGEDVSTPATPDSGSTYEPFQYRTLLQIAAALGIPYPYLTGDAARALPMLEKAAAKKSDPEINEHLGDVYWALGRRIDARYARHFMGSQD